MKYRDENGDFQDLYFKTGDTLPIGTEVDYDGETAPVGWEEIDNPEEYSTSEVKTNKIFDGKPVYRKVYTGTATGSNKLLEASIVNFNIIRIFGTVTNSSGSVNQLGLVANGYGAYAYKANNSIGGALILVCTSDITGAYNVIIEYTKTTD